MKSDGKHSARSFQKHERSEAHVKALVAFTTSQQGNDTASLFSEAFKTSKIKERAAMTVIFECYRFLNRQGLPFRGHLQNSGTATELLKLCGRFIFIYILYIFISILVLICLNPLLPYLRNAKLCQELQDNL